MLRYMKFNYTISIMIITRDHPYELSPKNTKDEPEYNSIINSFKIL